MNYRGAGNGECVGEDQCKTNSVDCSLSGRQKQCTVSSTCKNGSCQNVVKRDGTPCDGGGDGSTTSDVCRSGTCGTPSFGSSFSDFQPHFRRGRREDAAPCADANAAMCSMIADPVICETGLGPYPSPQIKEACAKTCGVCTTSPPIDAATDAPVRTPAAVTTDAPVGPAAVTACVTAKCQPQITSCFGVLACAGVSHHSLLQKW